MQSSLVWRSMIVLLGAAGCEAEESGLEIPPIIWSGAQLDYAPQPGAYELCEGTLPYMDRYVGLVADAMGGEVERPLIYVHGSEDGDSPCERDGVGCAFRDGVYAKVAPQEHEIVHGVRGWYGFSQLFFEEGTAEILGDDARFEMRETSNGDLMEGIEAASDETGLPFRWYPRAGHFVAHLHDRYGLEVTRALLLETDASSGAERAIEVIEDVTGVEWEDLVDEYAKEPECDQARFRYPLYGCEEPTALRARCEGDEAVFIRERIACDEPGTVGPRNGEIWKTIAVDVPEDGEYTFFSWVEEGAAGSRLVVEECALGCDKIMAEMSLGFDIPIPVVFLRKGRYALRLTRPEGAGTDASVRISGGGCG
ncbi:hypothetical protein [Paraliomyxa miuraensis]|uniref:hypothetical protein n=1 Tax=Paraliomyxa miuraensis TaxID=376150 RepID=UPI0022520317|nr:hypothetical protein [Paraliomyxa miuraensis]MCX4243757.1 hypothetical protein [Paraliomyxa miuraensis]